MTAAPKPLVAIITLNWNRKDDTLAFLASCAALRYPRLHATWRAAVCSSSANTPSPGSGR